MLAGFVRVLQHTLHATLLEQGHGRLECDEVSHARHVDAVAVGVADLGRARRHNDSLGLKTVQDAKDALLQSGAAHDAVVDHHQVVDAGSHGAVGDVVHVGHQVVSRAVFGDEGAQFRVLDGNFIDARALIQDGLDFLVVRVCTEAFDAGNFARVKVLFQPLDQPVKRRFGGVGNEARDRVIQIVFHGFQHTRDDAAPECFSFVVDVLVVAAREVDALEAAGLPYSRWTDLFHQGFAAAANEQGATWRHFLN